MIVGKHDPVERVPLVQIFVWTMKEAAVLSLKPPQICDLHVEEFELFKPYFLQLLNVLGVNTYDAARLAGFCFFVAGSKESCDFGLRSEINEVGTQSIVLANSPYSVWLCCKLLDARRSLYPIDETKASLHRCFTSQLV